ncbi:pyridoxal phosphate-dependent transferase [Lasiosphaeria miniovina]|uniref:Pyridoxal phosphate-dependent transferase n=1 Tax=Lasiosphaeria miniovina TaxID=1954250 RepID=A0AA40AD29_9PEZI|nr:pyridoxal phosphate-dependent transferase [Lasiosphaeria miniovina]KAK0713473.1 pyridoxal phosphate-dependent transferase [Lasiosphaeria miniovina]
MAPSLAEAAQQAAPPTIKGALDTFLEHGAKKALATAEARFIANNLRSKQLHELAVGVLPGGNTRSLLHTPPFPLSMKQGKGGYVWDEDSHKYVDFVGELSAGLYGHSHPAIRAAIVSTLDDVGLSLGSTTAQEQRFAAALCARFHLARVRMANSGTEANLHALAATRRFTGRRKVAVFAGGYHGAVLSFGGDGGTPAPNTVERGDFIVVAPYNDIAATRAAIAAAAPDLAAVLVEPIQGAGGCIRGTRDFLRAVQDAARAADALFMLDEVMTSRLAPGGLGATLGLDHPPDLVSLGKYLGGGLAFGAFGGRADVMAVYDPRDPNALAHSGTFNNNTLAMHAGYAGLADVFTPDACVAFNAKGDALRVRLAVGAARCGGTRLTFTGCGSLIGLYFTQRGVDVVASSDDLARAGRRTDLRDLFWFEMLEEGFWITRRGFIALILDTPDDELDRFVGAVAAFLERHREIMAL